MKRQNSSVPSKPLHRAVAVIAVVLSTGLFVAFAALLFSWVSNLPDGGPSIKPRIAKAQEADTVVTHWQRGPIAHVRLSVDTVYGSGDDNQSEDYKPKLTGVWLDGLQLSRTADLPGGHFAGSEGAEGSYSDLSTWTTAGQWSGRANTSIARQVVAQVCWPKQHSCVYVGFERCQKSLVEPFDSPRDANIFYASRDPDGNECGSAAVWLR